MEKTVKIAEGVHWVGIMHPELRFFDDLFPTERGTSYNSYLIQGTEKTALIDAVKGKFTEQFIDKIRSLTDPAKIDYIIVNHSEPDHTGALSELLDLCPNAVVISSQAAKNFLTNMMHRPFNSRVVKDGETVDLGGKTLRFISAPFLHWPDTIFTRLEEENFLFSCDAFGCHFCDPEHIFNDEVEDFTSFQEFYFDCILRPFSDKVLAGVEKIRHDVIDMVLPSHGPIIRRDPWKVIAELENMAKPRTENKKIVLLYISPHGNTEKMAKAVAQGAGSTGIEVACHAITSLDTNQIRNLFEEADALVFGIPTVVRDIPPPMWHVLAALTSVKLKTNKAALFGSYGWSGEACKMAEERLKGLGIKLVAEPVRTTFAPTEELLEQCVALGRKVAEEVGK